MDLKRLNHTDLTVSPLCLGCGQFGTGVPEPTARRQLDEFHGLGGNFIDTAHVYGNWVESAVSPSEQVIGRWAKDTGKRRGMVITTKGGHPDLRKMEVPRLHEEDILLDIDESLQYLQTDYIDLFLLHRDDPSIPVSVFIDLLDDCVDKGKIRYYGCSNWKLPRITEAADYARAKDSRGFVVNQSMWSLADINRKGLPSGDFTPMDSKTYEFQNTQGMNAMAYMSLAKAFFSRKAAGSVIPALVSGLYENPTNQKIYDTAAAYMEGKDYTFIDLSLQYLIQREDFPVIPVTAFRTEKQFQEGMRAMQKKIPKGIIDQLTSLKEYVNEE